MAGRRATRLRPSRLNTYRLGRQSLLGCRRTALMSDQGIGQGEIDTTELTELAG